MFSIRRELCPSFQTIDRVRKPDETRLLVFDMLSQLILKISFLLTNRIQYCFHVC